MRCLKDERHLHAMSWKGPKLLLTIVEKGRFYNQCELKLLTKRKTLINQKARSQR
jgi:hypothetical protein